MKLSNVIGIAALFVVNLPATAAEERRELGAHAHGVGRLNIAIEGKRVLMELEIPGADIVGFEHEASTAPQKATVNRAKEVLEGALNVFKLPAEARCKLAEAKVAVHSGEGNEHNHGEAASKTEVQRQGEGDSHSEFRAKYTIDCSAPEKFTGINFRYFELFATARELDVNLVTADGQTHYKVTHEKPQLTFGQIG